MGIKPFDDIHGSDSTNIFVDVNQNYEFILSAKKGRRRYAGRMGMYEQIMERLAALESNQSAMARRAKIPHDQVRSFFTGRNVGIKTVTAMLEAVGARIAWPGEEPEMTRDVCWVDSKVVRAGKGQALPPAENYLAVPLVGETGAGPGVMSDDQIKSWVLVYRHQHAIQLKSDLLAVEIERGSTSMVPLLHPGDIVLVDREDKKPERRGNIFLVREPHPSSATMIKRVSMKPIDGDVLLTFYSEDSAENPAESFNLRVDYDNDISNAIVGRCVWVWSDLTRR